ncbi:MAG: glycosyltransferase family 1 protein, partial [Pseudorhodoplanes sp.]
MRILISSVAVPPSIGGLETAAVGLANGLAARGHVVTVVSPMTTSEWDVYPFTGVRSPVRATRWRLS